MAAFGASSHTTPEEYLRLERASPSKHEYLDGDVVAIAGASREHTLITGNLSWRLNERLADRDCEVYASEVRVRLAKANSYVYPDIAVVCGDRQSEDEVFDTLLNPTVVIEVLSPSTARYDRVEKFAAYRALPSIQAIVLVAQDMVGIDWFTRRGDAWAIERVAELDGTLRLEPLGCDVAVADIYRRVDLPGQATEGEREAAEGGSA